MFRKSFIAALVAFAFVALLQVTVSAQTAPISGKVELQKADGTKEPVGGALVEVYRTDIKAGGPSTKTNKKGEFTFAGLIMGSDYALSVSATNCAPQVYPNVRAGQERILVTLSPGDGTKLSEADVRRNLASATKGEDGEEGAGGGGMTDEQKKQQAEYEKLNAEIKAKNEKMAQADEIARRANEEGNVALKAGNYDLAIEKYTEGVTAVPDFVGSTPILLSGKIAALKLKGAAVFNDGVKVTDKVARAAKFQEAAGYYDQALDAFQNAVDVIKRAPASTDPVEQKRRESMTLALYSNAVELHKLKAATKTTTEKSATAAVVIPEYIALESDPAKKLAAQMTLGDIYRTTGDLEKAIAAYREVMAGHPDNTDAMGKLGISLYAQGASVDPEDKAMEQEGLNLMQKYIEMAPVAATDSASEKEFKTSVKETVDYLKAQNMTPQKTPTKKRN